LTFWWKEQKITRNSVAQKLKTHFIIVTSPFSGKIQ